jgi:hypothetical protein
LRGRDHTVPPLYFHASLVNYRAIERFALEKVGEH